MKINDVVLFTDDGVILIGVVSQLVTTETISETAEEAKITVEDFDGNVRTETRRQADCQVWESWNDSNVVRFIRKSSIAERAFALHERLKKPTPIQPQAVPAKAFNDEEIPL